MITRFFMNKLSLTIQPNKSTQHATTPVVDLSRNTTVQLILWVILLLAASLFPIWVASGNLYYHNDDTYITLTYAKSLAEGQGWRYNSELETLGTTTPLFALVVAGLAYFLPMQPIVESAVGLSAFCWLATGWLFFLGHRRFGLTRRGGAFIGLSVLLQAGWWQPTFGMEATFLLFGLMFNIWLIARGHAFLSGLVSGLLFLIRPEGLAMVPLTGAWLLWHQRSTWRETFMRFAFGVFVSLGLWVWYAQSTFGSILPNSAMAKLGQGKSWPGKLFIERLTQEWLPIFARRYGFSSFCSLVWPLLLIGLIDNVQRMRSLLLLGLWTVVFLAGYTYLNAPGYWWYMMPVFFTLYIFALLGILFFLEQPRRWMQITGLVVALFYLSVTLKISVQNAYQKEVDPRASTYLAVAEWLNSNTPLNSTVAFVEIGYLGYFTENRIIDLVGLIDPAYRDNGVHLNLASNFWQAEPDYFLYVPDFDWLLASIVEDERFPQRYRIVTEVPSHFSTPLMIYQKQ